MKLGYVFTVTAGGYDDTKARVNDGSWSNIVEDERQLWLKYNVDGDVLAMTHTKEGLTLVVSRVVGGSRADNNVTTWVHIPAKAILSGAEIMEVVEAVRELQKGSSKNITSESFVKHPVLGKDYRERRYPMYVASSGAGELGARHATGDYTLKEILDNPCQSYYRDFKYIFLYNRSGAVAADLKNLSNNDIIENICVFPPSAASLRNMFGTDQVTVRLEDGSQFAGPRAYRRHQKLHLTVERPGFLAQTVMGEAVGDEEEIMLAGGRNEWRKVISPSNFIVVDSKTDRELTHYDYQLDINDPFYDREHRTLPEDRLSRVNVNISAKGYQPFSGVFNLSGAPVTVSLKKVEKAVKRGYGVLPGSDSTPSAQNFLGTPVSVNGKNPNVPGHSKFAWKEFILGAGSVVALILLLWLGLVLFGSGIHFGKEDKSYSGSYGGGGSATTTEVNDSISKDAPDPAPAKENKEENPLLKEELKQGQNPTPGAAANGEVEKVNSNPDSSQQKSPASAQASQQGNTLQKKVKDAKKAQDSQKQSGTNKSASGSNTATQKEKTLPSKPDKKERGGI